MAKFILQTGKEEMNSDPKGLMKQILVWTDSETVFESKKDAREWYAKKFADNWSYDWQVGFLVRTREGIYYNLIDAKSRQDVSYGRNTLR